MPAAYTVTVFSAAMRSVRTLFENSGNKAFTVPAASLPIANWDSLVLHIPISAAAAVVSRAPTFFGVRQRKTEKS